MFHKLEFLSQRKFFLNTNYYFVLRYSERSCFGLHQNSVGCTCVGLLKPVCTVPIIMFNYTCQQHLAWLLQTNKFSFYHFFLFPDFNPSSSFDF